MAISIDYYARSTPNSYFNDRKLLSNLIDQQVKQGHIPQENAEKIQFEKLAQQLIAKKAAKVPDDSRFTFDEVEMRHWLHHPFYINQDKPVIIPNIPISNNLNEFLDYLKSRYMFRFDSALAALKIATFKYDDIHTSPEIRENFYITQINEIPKDAKELLSVIEALDHIKTHLNTDCKTQIEILYNHFKSIAQHNLPLSQTAIGFLTIFELLKVTVPPDDVPESMLAAFKNLRAQTNNNDFDLQTFRISQKQYCEKAFAELMTTLEPIEPVTWEFRNRACQPTSDLKAASYLFTSRFKSGQEAIKTFDSIPKGTDEKYSLIRALFGENLKQKVSDLIDVKPASGGGFRIIVVLNLAAFPSNTASVAEKRNDELNVGAGAGTATPLEADRTKDALADPIPVSPVIFSVAATGASAGAGVVSIAGTQYRYQR